jgi:tRNA (guanine37-N1)-methyltransferase
VSLVCGRYEGIDDRVMAYVDEELSLGDFVMTGGEPAALAMLDAVTRLLPGVLGNAYSTEEESFGDGLLEYPQYTRPATFRGVGVPDVLKGGNHARVADWRRGQSLLRTSQRRPGLMIGREMSDKDVRLLEEAELFIDGKEESVSS